MNHDSDQDKDGRSGAPRLTLGRAQRLKGKKIINAAYKQGKRRVSHPLTVHGLRREDNGKSRLGISVGRKVGNSVQRNLIKRRIREAYRTMQNELPEGTDWLVLVRPHQALAMRTYQEKLRQLLR